MTFKKQLQKKIEREVESYDSSHLSEKQSFLDGTSLLSDLLVECEEFIRGLSMRELDSHNFFEKEIIMRKLQEFVKEGGK